jgi:hypothetical protein
MMTATVNAFQLPIIIHGIHHIPGGIHGQKVNGSHGEISNESGGPVPPAPPSYQVLWGAEYPDGLISTDVAADRNNDAYVCGIDQFGGGLLVKYSGATGDVLWADNVVNSVQYPGQNQNPLGTDLHSIRNLMTQMTNQRFGFDTSSFQILVGGVDVDSHNDVVAVATAYDFGQSDVPSDVYVAKYKSSDGSVLWEKYITFYTFDSSMGVTVDKDDNIIVAGVSGGVELRNGQVIPIMDSWMYKLAGTDGHMLHMDHIYGIAQPLPYYLDVDADSQNNYFATGPALNIDWSNFPHSISVTQTSILNKYSAALHLTTTYLWPINPYTFILTICVDTSNTVYIGGWINTDGGSREYIVKFNNNLNSVLWSIPNQAYSQIGTIMRLANMSDSRIVAASDLSNTIYEGYMTTEIFRATSGNFELRINEGRDVIHDAYATATIVDRANNIITTGMRAGPGSGDWYTMKYHLVTGGLGNPQI